MIAFADDSASNVDQPLPNDPTPDEIAQRAAEIRRKWSATQRTRRRVIPEQNWVPQTVSSADIAANVPSAPSI